MDWIRHKLALEDGCIIKIRPRGNSMMPKIKSGQEVTIQPVRGKLLVGDIVLCRVKGTFYVHLVSATRINAFGKMSYQISNNKGHVNGWIPRENIYGQVVQIND